MGSFNIFNSYDDPLTSKNIHYWVTLGGRSHAEPIVFHTIDKCYDVNAERLCKLITDLTVRREYPLVRFLVLTEQP